MNDLMGRHFYTNIDINSVVTPFLNRAAEIDAADPAVLYPFVDAYAGTQITDILFDVFCQYSAVDSAIWSSCRDKYLQKEENGLAVDYTDRYKGICAFHANGIDPYSVWFARCRERELYPWLSVRMNDCHCPDEEACFLRSDFFYEARAKGWTVGEKYGYYRWCFDYAVPEVRRRMLGYIAELLDRYDVDGLELDFQRELFCFNYVNCPGRLEIMNGFMREVRGLVRGAERRLGHPVRLSVRIQRDIAQNRIYGFDAETWVHEGLVDLIVVSPRWTTNDSDMPLDAWKRAFPEVEIAAGLTDLILQRWDLNASPAALAGYALQYLQEGADSIYLYNLFIGHHFLAATAGVPRMTEAALYELYAAHDRSGKTSVYDCVNRTCGEIGTAAASSRRHIVTWQDSVPEGAEGWKPLPMREGEVPIRTGRLTAGRKAALLLGFSEGGPEDVCIRVNGREMGPFLPCEGGALDEGRKDPFVPEGSRLYRAELADDGEPVRRITFSDSRGAELSYMEIEVYGSAPDFS